jgi:hypothetical protein
VNKKKKKKKENKRRALHLFFIYFYFKNIGENYSLAPQITTRFALCPTNCQHSDSGLPNYQNL